MNGLDFDGSGSLDKPGGAFCSDWLGVAELREALRLGRVTARQLTDDAIARIEAGDRSINAVVVRDFAHARVAADEADRQLASGDRRPLLGIPMTVKESYDVAGLPTTWGLSQALDARATHDAVLVGRIKAAGAIVLGKTNVPVLLGDWQSYNHLYGVTRNPWNLERTPGGSSGGAAAALAAGFVPLELGSDIGGSLRVPAHYCGVYAHKPSQGLLPQRGHTPPGARQSPRDVDLLVTGPMARNAADLSELFELLAGPDEPLATGYQLALPAPRHRRLADFRVLALTDHPSAPTSAEVAAAIDALATQLAQSGAKVWRQHAALPDLALNARVYTQMLYAYLAADFPVPIIEKLRAQAAGLLPEDTSLAAERLRGQVMSHRDWVHVDRQRGGLIARWRELFREIDIVLCPVIATTAMVHDHSPFTKRTIEVDGQVIPYNDQLVWPGLATLPGLPATVVPIGRSSSGLPIGAQLIGPFLEDRTPLSLAACLEQAFGGFVRPPALAG